MSNLNGSTETFIHQINDRSIRNETKINDLAPRVDRLENAVIKVLLAAAAGGGVAGLLARFLG